VGSVLVVFGVVGLTIEQFPENSVVVCGSVERSAKGVIGEYKEGFEKDVQTVTRKGF
jgi:hypothetical protein